MKRPQIDWQYNGLLLHEDVKPLEEYTDSVEAKLSYALCILSSIKLKHKTGLYKISDVSLNEINDLLEDKL